MKGKSFLLGFALFFAAGPAAFAETMTAHVIDVGQGAATLLEFSCGAVLVDTGGEQNSQFKSRDKLREYLNEFFERRTDLDQTLALVVLSHPHMDHIRGVDELLDPDNEFMIGGVVDNSQTPLSGTNNQNQLRARGLIKSRPRTNEARSGGPFLSWILLPSKGHRCGSAQTGGEPVYSVCA